MIQTFDPSFRSIRVPAEFVGPNGPQSASLCLDTGASQSAIRFSSLVAAGFSLTDAIASYEVATGAGIIRMSEFLVPRFSALGQSAADFRVLAAFDVPGITHDGVLGLDFFRGKLLKIDFHSGTIELQ